MVGIKKPNNTWYSYLVLAFAIIYLDLLIVVIFRTLISCATRNCSPCRDRGTATSARRRRTDHPFRKSVQQNKCHHAVRVSYTSPSPAREASVDIVSVLVVVYLRRASPLNSQRHSYSKINKKHFSCEIETFVATHICKLCA